MNAWGKMDLFAPRTWSPSERRIATLSAGGVGAVALVALVVALVAGRGGLAFLSGLLLALAGGVAAAAFLGGRSAAQSRPAPVAEVEDEGPPVLEETLLSVKCGRCGTVFDVTETGQRPLRHACPGCGAAGVLEGEPARFVRVRCGACGHLDRIADPGARPLRHRCPRCGKLGQTR